VARRLKYLQYKVVPLIETITVAENAEPLEVTLSGFRCAVTSQTLTAEPIEDEYTYHTEAHSALESALEAWSATSELIDICPVTFELQGHHYEVIVPEGNQVVYAHGFDESVAVDDVVTVAKPLPPPHGEIRHEGPVAAQLRRRWRNVVHGTESITAVGYYVLTAIEENFDGRSTAATRLNISRKVFDELSRITSIYDPVHGRKASKRVGTITDEQLNWIKHACPAIIRRVLEAQAHADISRQITKADLPQLSP
jgi:hypothetical protein